MHNHTLGLIEGDAFIELRDACYRGDLQQLQKMIAAGADVNIKSDMGVPLIASINHSVYLIDCVKILVNAGCDINAKSDSRGTTLLMRVCRDRIYHVKDLLELGADADIKDIYGNNALKYAISSSFSNMKRVQRKYLRYLSQRSFEMVNLLIKYGADVNAVDNEGFSVLDRVSRSKAFGKKYLIRLLKANGFILFC